MCEYLDLKDFLSFGLPRITHEEEIDLAVSIQKNFVPLKTKAPLSAIERGQFKKGSRDREKLIRSNLGLIKRVARKFESSGIEARILLDFGMIGLILATESYDPYKINPKTEKPYKFSTHATWQIFREVGYGVSQFRVIKIPSWISNSLSTLKKVTIALKSSLKRPPTDSEIIAQMPPTGKHSKPFTQERLDFLRRAIRLNCIASIDAMKSWDDENESTLDLPDSFDIWQEIELREELEIAQKLKAKSKKTKKKRSHKKKKKALRFKDFSKKMATGCQLGLKISVKLQRRSRSKNSIRFNSRSGIDSTQLTLDLEASTIVNIPQFDRNVRRHA